VASPVPIYTTDWGVSDWPSRSRSALPTWPPVLRPLATSYLSESQTPAGEWGDWSDPDAWMPASWMENEG
jgi:hypothetical protein